MGSHRSFQTLDFGFFSPGDALGYGQQPRSQLSSSGLERGSKKVARLSTVDPGTLDRPFLEGHLIDSYIVYS